MDRFEADVMDDLMSDAAEGPAARQANAYDEFDEGDEFDEFDGADGADAGDDEFIGRLLGGIGRVAGGLFGGGAAGGGEGFDEGDEFDEFDEGDEFDAAGEDYGDDGGDAFEAAVADAMDAGDGDEFFRRLGRIARTVGRGIGSAARVVGPIASMIPIPQAQLIGRLANVAGRLLADGADEFEAFDEMVDGLDEDGVDAAAPVLAGMVIRRALPAVARAAAPVRRAAVRAVAQAVRGAVRRQGPQAARAVARAVTATRRIAQRRRLPARQTVQLMRRVTRQVAARPAAVQRLARPLVTPARRATPRGQAAQVVARQVAPIARQVAATTGRAVAPVRGGAGGQIGHVCPNCRGGRRILARGPVVINLRCR